jgi:hypothetical protein
MTTTLTEKTFAQLFTFSGAGAGTCVNAQGWVQPSATPRFDHDPITKAAKGLLIEPGRTNQIGYASRLELWSRVSLVSVVPEAALAPNGRYDACRLVLGVGATSGTPFVNRTVTKSASAVQYTCSAYLKPAGHMTGVFMLTGASASDRVNLDFNLDTKSVTATLFGGFSAASWKLVDAGNGWQRLEGTVTSDASTVADLRIYPKAISTGAIDGVNGLLVWGVQLEEGPFATSHIPSLETFTGRTSIGCYYDANGIMRTAAAGAARLNYEPSDLSLAPVLLLEGASTNLLQKSGDMHLAPWGAPGASRETGKLAPDGTLRAVQVSGAATGPFVNSTAAAATATTMTFSVFVKNVSRSWGISLLLRNNSTGVNYVTATVNLHLPGPTIVGAGWEMRPVGNGWYRCTYTQTGITVGHTLSCYVGFTGGGPDGGAFQVWGAQLEAGAYATSYIPSTETFTSRTSIGTYFDATGALKVAAAGEARMTYNPADLTVAPWLLLEGSTSNLFTESEFRNGVTDASTRSGVTAATMSGFAGAIQFPAGGSTTIYAAKLPAVALSTSTVYTLSVIVEMDDGQPPVFGGSTSVPGNSFVLVLANSGYATNTYSVQHLGGARWRVSGSFTSPATITSAHTGVYRYGQNQNRGFKITALQLEQAPLVSSYIPTTTATVTRAADTSTSAATTRVADTHTSGAHTRSTDTVRIDAKKGWFNPAEGTVAMQMRVPTTPETATRNLLEFGDTTLGNRTGVGFQTSGAVYGYCNVGGSGLNTSTMMPAGAVFKASLSYGSDGMRLGCNGEPLKKAAPNGVPPVTFLGLGCTASGGNQPCIHIRDVRYFPQRLTDAEVVALTA